MRAVSEKPLRVLVVDDNRDAVQVLALLLRKHGHEVQIAYSGSEALLSAEIFQPDCIISDIGMPGLDGYEVARQLRANQRFRHTPLIALSAYSEAERARSAGFDHHLVKPANSADVVAIVEEFGGLRRRMEQMEDVAEEQTKVLGEVKDLLHEVKDEVRVLNTDLKEEVQELKQELQEVKEEVQEIKEELKQSQA